jgi:hypothetical protein
MKRLIILACLALVVFGTVASAEISALEMRQNCRGVEAARLNGDQIFLDSSKYPNALTCWGSFSTLHQQSLWFDDATPIFLPGVCSITNGHGQKAVVFVKVFTRYVDEHPQIAGKDFFAVAWEAFKAAWPCPN